jgi:hypothetical protein
MAESNGEVVVSYAMRFFRRVYCKRAGGVLVEISTADSPPIDINCNLNRSEKKDIKIDLLDGHVLNKSQVIASSPGYIRRYVRADIPLRVRGAVDQV